jgi:hypothetical protein
MPHLLTLGHNGYSDWNDLLHHLHTDTKMLRGANDTDIRRTLAWTQSRCQ